MCIFVQEPAGTTARSSPLMPETAAIPSPRRRSAAKPKEKVARKRHSPPENVDRRAHILEAAGRVFELHGIDGANMRAIAKEAGYTPGALYFYYTNREEIYADLLTMSLFRLRDATQTAARGNAPPAERVRAGSLAFYDYYSTRPDEMSLGFYLFRGLGPHGLTEELDKRLNAQFWATLTAVLDPLVELGRTEVEAVRVLTAIFAHASGLLLLVHTGRIRMFHQDGRELFRSFVEGLVCTGNAEA